MAMTDAAYRSQLRALLPQGAAWPREEGTTLDDLLDAMSQELARIDERTDDLLDEADPRTTSELLADWERVAGLPDPCGGEDQTPDERRASLVAHLTALGGQSRNYFIGVAAQLGFEVEIQEFPPFVAGSSAGDSITNGPLRFKAGARAGQPLSQQTWRFVWAVKVDESTLVPFVASGSYAGDRLVGYDRRLMCTMQRLKPAHTMVMFGTI